MPGTGWVQPEPFGVCLILGPWNYPVQLLLSPLVACLAAGNCAILKPSEHAPATAAILAEMVSDSFSPDAVCLVQGERETAESLLELRFDKIFFTGSTAVGKRVMAAAANHLTPVSLELGGKSPCIVTEHASLDVAVRRIVWGKFLNAGQTCVAPDFVCVHKSIHQTFLDKCRKELIGFYGENPRSSPDYARIVNDHHFARLEALINGEAIVVGGEMDRHERYFAPTILTNVNWDSPVMHEEIFGPILPVLSYDKLDDVVKRLCDHDTPLALYVFSDDRVEQETLVRDVRSGGVCINDTVTHILCHELPFGGLGSSGLGRYRGKAGFDAFSHDRSVLRRSTRFDPGMRYPPYKTPLATLRTAMRFLSGG
jgi:aldehyde dehydrogenase (NAD+)